MDLFTHDLCTLLQDGDYLLLFALFFCCVAATKNFFAGVAAAGAKTLKITVHETGALDTDMTYERAEFEFLQEDGTTFKHGK